MENFANDAYDAASLVHNALVKAKEAQEEDDKRGEELDRTKERFVERFDILIKMNARIQEEICKIIREHNNQ
jgi:hypothetical protein